MTASYNPKPQRQVRNTVASPAKAPDPAGVDRPSQIWQQLGGQLIDNRSYENIIKPQKDTMNAIMDFIGEDGGYTAMGEWRDRDYEEKIAKKVNDVYKKTAEAEVTNSLITEEVERLKQEKLTREAEELLRRNNLADHYWKLLDSDLAAKEVSIGLESFGKNNAEALAGLNVQQRASVIQKKKNELLAPFSDLDQDYINAYVEPYALSANNSIKKVIAEEVNKQNKIQNEELGMKKVINGLREAAKYSEVANENDIPQLEDFSVQKLNSAYSEGYTEFAKHNPLYVKAGSKKTKQFPHGTLTKEGERAYHQMWFNYAPILYLNKDGDNYNDVATRFHYGKYREALSKIKTQDGVPILSLVFEVDGRSMTLEQRLADQMNRAIMFRTQLENAEFSADRNAATKAENNIKELFNKRYPTLESQEDVLELRKEIKDKFLDDNNQPINIPKGYSPSEWFTKIDEMVPEFFKPEDSISTRTNLEIMNKMLTDQPFADIDDINLDMDMSAYGFEGTYGQWFESIKNTGSHKTLLTKISNNGTQAASKLQDTVETISSQLEGDLLENFKTNSTAYQELLSTKSKFLPKVDESIEKATAAANLLLNRQARQYLRSELLKLKPHERLLPENQSKILADAKRLFFEQPNFKDINRWITMEPGPDLGRPKEDIPIGFGDKWSNDSGWTNGIDSDYNLENWSVIAKPYFVRGASGSPDGRKNALNYVTNNFVLSDRALNEINTALVTGNMDAISDQTEKDLTHIKYGLDGNLSKGEVAQAQLNRLYSKNKGKPPVIDPDNYLRLNDKSEESTPVTSTGKESRDENLFVYPQYTDTHQGIEFKVQRGNGVQTSNNILSPFSGKVVKVGNYEDGGLTVVLESDTELAGAPKGTRIVLKHCGVIPSNVAEGQFISKGTPLCIAGNQTFLPNAGEGSTTGQDIEAGHVVIQFAYPGAELDDDGYVSKIAFEGSTDEAIPDGFYNYELVGGEMDGVLPVEHQSELFLLYFQPQYESTTIDSSESDLNLENNEILSEEDMDRMGLYNYSINTTESE